MGNTNNTSPRAINVRFSSFKGKQTVYSAAKKLKGQNIYRKKKWSSVKSLRSQGKYATLVYEKIVVKGKFRKQ